jgi:ATP-binding cassette, subfamily C, bacterial CydD
VATVSVEKRILSESRPARRGLYAAVAAGWLAAGLFVAQAWLLSVVVGRVFLGHQGLGAVQGLLLFMLGLLIVRGGLIWLSDILAQAAAGQVKEGLRDRLIGHLQALGPAYTGGERSGELVNTAVEGVETLDAYLTQYLPARYLAGLAPALVFLVVLLLDPWTTPVYLIAGPFLVLLLALIGGRTQAITERRFAELSWLSAHFLDMLQGLPTLKLFGRSREQAANIEEISRRYGQTTMDVLRTAFQTSLVMEWAATAATALVALEVSLRLMAGTLPFDHALAVLLLTPEFFLPLRTMALRYHAGTAGKNAAARIYEILDTPSSPIAARPSSLVPLSQSWEQGGIVGDIQFRDVSFAYEAGERAALRGLSCTFRQGEMTALVGPTGAGKTTAAYLLLRFGEPQTGSISVGGAALAGFEPAAWRKRVAWVGQRPHLFDGTAAENIRLARPGAPDDEVVAAARAAHADEFIRALPQGYDTPLGERGARLSGGQAQRIAIARAFLKDAPLLILDEATVHLDAAIEALVHEALERLRHGRTVVIIAHRLRLATLADQVIVLDGGRAVDVGSPADLLARQGHFRRLSEAYGLEEPVTT